MKKLVLLFGAALIFSACDNNNGLSGQDEDFAEDAAQSSMLEIKLGELAQRNGSSQDVKDMAGMIIRDHRDASDKLKTITDAKNIQLDANLDDDHQDKYDDLASKTGRDFDMAYADMMVKSHEKSISKFEKQEEKGEDMELKNFASNTLPTLRNHLEMAKDMQNRLENMDQMESDTLNNMNTMGDSMNMNP